MISGHNEDNVNIIVFSIDRNLTINFVHKNFQSNKSFNNDLSRYYCYFSLVLVLIYSFFLKIQKLSNRNY